MAILGSDFHANVAKCHKFLNYKPDKQHVFLGDAVDSYTEPVQNSLKCLQMLTESDSVLIYGNHELSYHPVYTISCSGRTSYGMNNYPLYLSDTRWIPAYTVDGYVLTHAGVAASIVGKYKSPKYLVNYLTKLFKEKNKFCF